MGLRSLNLIYVFNTHTHALSRLHSLSGGKAQVREMTSSLRRHRRAIVFPWRNHSLGIGCGELSRVAPAFGGWVANGRGRIVRIGMAKSHMCVKY
jgi:hypothetical protein